MKRSSRALWIVLVAWSLQSCGGGARRSAGPAPESQQVVGEAMKELYMRASAAAPGSPEQQKVILKMAREASNGKELMLVMRAAVGVFPSASAEVAGTVAGKMMQFGTLDQLIEYATQYPVEAITARPFVERMLQLAEGASDPRVWYRIRAAATRLKVADLGQKAQARADDLARQ